jgi:hypothetical protein
LAKAGGPIVMKFSLIQHFNYIYFSKEYDTTHIKKYHPLLFFPFIWVKTAYHLFVNLIHVSKLKSPHQKLLFYCRSIIDHQAVQDVFQKTQVPKIILFEKKIKPFEVQEGLFPLGISLTLSFLLTPLFILDYFRYYRKPEYIDRDSFLRGMEDIYMTYGRYALTRFLFHLRTPTGIVISNDHCYDTLIMIHFANRMNIPSMYIQHASVGDFFPKLEMSLALLEGQDAKEVYLKRGSDPDRIRLVGMPKFDKHFSAINRSTVVRSIGIALNGLEDLRTFHKDVIAIAGRFAEMDIIIRPHPILYTRRYKAEYNQFVKELEDISNIRYSDSRSENPWVFLSRVDLQIAGDTSIHMEATLLNITSVYYSNNPYYRSLDLYRFNKNSLVPYIFELSELLEFINAVKHNRTPVRSKAKYYCDTVDTENDGKSCKLTVDYISAYLNSYPELPKPTPSTDFKFSAYV